MLDSWFGSKSSRHSQRFNPPPALDNAQSDVSSEVSQSTVGPLRTPGNLTSASDVPLDEVHAHINDPSVYAPTTTPSLIHSAEKATTSSTDQRGSARQVSAPERLEGTLCTPQDAMIAQVLGRSAPPATDPAQATPPPPRQSAALMTPDSPSRLGPTLPVYEPFSGAKLGGRTPRLPATAVPGQSSPLPATDDRTLWSSLERILELQAEVAAMHADMEGVGARGSGNAHAGGVGTGEGGNGGSRKGSRRGGTLLVGDEETEEHEPEGGAIAGPAVSEIFTDHSDGEDEDEDDRNEDGIHGYGKKRRDEEFSKLAEQFAQRKVAIGGIMNKLDDLSMALKTFHALPPPLLDLAMSTSRADTMSSTPSNVSATSSSPRVYFGRPSPPPVPPISTLAPPASSESALPAPVLPRTSMPTAVAGAFHVDDSPAEVDTAQSILTR